MPVARFEAVAVLNEHAITVTALHPGEPHYAVGGRYYRRARRDSDINALMELDAAEYRVAPPTEPGTDMAGARFYSRSMVEDMAGTRLGRDNFGEGFVLELSLAKRQLKVVDVLVATELYHLRDIRKRAADARFPHVDRYGLQVVYHP